MPKVDIVDCEIYTPLRRGLSVFVFLILIAGAILLYFTNPYNPESASLIPPCQLYYITGYYCPGCGTGRAMYSILHLHPIVAFKHNPFLFLVILPILGFFALSELRIIFTGRSIPFKCSNNSGYYLIAVMLTFTLLRNLPWWPFTCLAP